MAHIDQAPRLQFVALIGGLVGAQRDIAIDAALQVAPVRRRHQALRDGLEFEDIQRLGGRGRQVLIGECAGPGREGRKQRTCGQESQ